MELWTAFGGLNEELEMRNEELLTAFGGLNEELEMRNEELLTAFGGIKCVRSEEFRTEQAR